MSVSLRWIFGLGRRVVGLVMITVVVIVAMVIVVMMAIFLIAIMVPIAMMVGFLRQGLHILAGTESARSFSVAPARLRTKCAAMCSFRAGRASGRRKVATPLVDTFRL
jgi:hypothetical protein